MRHRALVRLDRIAACAVMEESYPDMPGRRLADYLDRLAAANADVR